MLKRIIALGLTFVICGLSVCVSAQGSVKFYNKNNIQINEIEDGQKIKIDCENPESTYVAMYSENGRLTGVDNIASGEIFVSKGTRYITVFGFDENQSTMGDIVTLPVVPNDPSNDAEENFISIADVYNNAKAMYSLTTDDGYAYTTAFLDKKFRDYGLKGTMGLVTSWMGNEGKMTWEEAEKYVNSKDSVWGVASHTKNHYQSNFGSLNEAQMEIEIGDAYRELKEHFPNERILAVWTPGGIVSDASFKTAYKYHLISRRTAGGATHNYLPMIKEELTYLAVYGVYANTTYDVMKGWADNAVERGQWLVEMWHGIGDKDAASWGGNASESDATSYLLYISKLQKEGKLWVATIDEAAAYTMEKMNARISVTEKTDDVIKFAITDDLDDAVYYEPLTVNITLPEGWNTAKVTQGSTTIPSTVKDGILTVNVKPDAGEIVIKK